LKARFPLSGDHVGYSFSAPFRVTLRRTVPSERMIQTSPTPTAFE
jgi:hypothetical protein